MKKITPFLWFDNQAEEAANFYVSIFKDSKILSISHYSKEGAKVSGRPEGSVLVVSFQIEGQEFSALNGGPEFTFSPAISFAVNCETQEEVDELWEKLTEGGKPGQCGWLTDKYGVSWQIVPSVLEPMINDPDPEKANRVMAAMILMSKLDIEKLKAAYDVSP